MAEAMLARRMHSSRGRPSARPPMKKPVKVSPAAVVSTASARKACWRTVSTPSGPTAWAMLPALPSVISTDSLG